MRSDGEMRRIPMLPGMRHALGAWVFVLAATLLSISVLTGVTDAGGAVAGALFGGAGLWVAWRWRRLGAVLSGDTLVMHGMWRSRAFRRADVTGVRVEPIRKSIVRSFYTGELLVSHEVVIQLQGKPVHSAALGMSFTSQDTASHFAGAVRQALRESPEG